MQKILFLVVCLLISDVHVDKHSFHFPDWLIKSIWFDEKHNFYMKKNPQKPPSNEIKGTHDSAQ